MEHGLVDAAEGLNAGTWGYGSKDFKKKPASMTSDMHHGVAHAIYRIYQKLDKDKNTTFKIVLGTDLEAPTSRDVYEVISRIAHRVGAGAKVDEVLDGLGVGPLSRELKKLQDQAQREGLSHTEMARRTYEMTNRQIIAWLEEWLRDREIDEAEK